MNNMRTRVAIIWHFPKNKLQFIERRKQSKIHFHEIHTHICIYMEVSSIISTSFAEEFYIL